MRWESEREEEGGERERGRRERERKKGGREREEEGGKFTRSGTTCVQVHLSSLKLVDI